MLQVWLLLSLELFFAPGMFNSRKGPRIFLKLVPFLHYSWRSGSLPYLLAPKTFVFLEISFLLSFVTTYLVPNRYTNSCFIEFNVLIYKLRCGASFIYLSCSIVEELGLVMDMRHSLQDEQWAFLVLFLFSPQHILTKPLTLHRSCFVWRTEGVNSSLWRWKHTLCLRLIGGTPENLGLGRNI